MKQVAGQGKSDFLVHLAARPPKPARGEAWLDMEWELSFTNKCRELGIAWSFEFSFCLYFFGMGALRLQ